MQGNLRKALEIISRHAAIAQGNRSFGHLRPKIGGDESLGIEDGDEVGEGEMHGMPSKMKTPGEELNSTVQDHVLGHQDHELVDDEFLPGSEPMENEPEPDESQAPKSGQMGFMSTKPMGPKTAPYPRDGIHETAKRRRGRPRGSKA